MKQENVFAALIAPLQRAVAEEGYSTPTPIQEQAIPHLLEGKDLLGCAQTGTGKTAAFTLPLLQEMCQTNITPAKGRPRALILTPTRELAAQIGDSIKTYGRYVRVSHTVIFGGVGQNPQVVALQRGVDVVVATPGRLIDLMDQGHIHLDRIELFILDEADRMLDMGFIPDVRRIVYKTPPKEKRQTLLFSATLDDEVMRLASDWMVDPGKIEIEPDHTATELVDQRVYLVTDKEKFSLLFNILKKEVLEGTALIFTNRRDQTERLADALYRYGIDCEILSGAVAQNKRQRILADFKEGRCKLVVATDVAGRGIHVDDITHVVNFNIPSRPDDYVHRIGRTGRAGKKGISVTFACEMESFELPAIEELLGERLTCYHPEPDMLQLPAPVRKPRPRTERPPQSGGRGGPRGGGGGRPPRGRSGPRR